MMKYLLILLIQQIILFNCASGQFITIRQSGTRIFSAEVQEKFSDTTMVLKQDSTQIKIQNKIDLKNKTVVGVYGNVSAPLNNRLFVTSDFGKRFHPILHSEKLHEGIDLRANYEFVNSIASGIIVKEGFDTRSGNYIVIQHGNGIESIYCHLSKFLLKSGDLVFAGDKIAISGATGEVTAPHLHFAIKVDGKFIDPIPLLKAIIEYNDMH